MRRFRLLAPALALLAAGCGAAHTTPALPAGAAQALHTQLSAVQNAAERGDRGAALGALTRFASLVSADARAGRLTGAEQRALQSGIDRTRARIDASIQAPRAPATTVRTPAPASGPPATPPGHRHDHGHGRGHGPHKHGGKQ